MKKQVKNVTVEKKISSPVYYLPEGMSGQQFTQFINENRSEPSEVDESLRPEEFPRGKAKNRKKATGESFKKSAPIILFSATGAPEREILTAKVTVNGAEVLKKQEESSLTSRLACSLTLLSCLQSFFENFSVELIVLEEKLEVEATLETESEVIFYTKIQIKK